MATKRTTKTGRKRRRTSTRRGALAGISLGNLKSTNKKEVGNMLKTSGAIVLGYVVGQAGSKLVRKQFAQGDQEGFMKWIEPLVGLAGGFLVSQTGKKNEFVRVMGTGIMASGVMSAIETATGKSLMELIGMGEATAGMGNMPAIESVDFDMNLPELNNVDTRGDDIPDYAPQAASDFAGAGDDSIL